MPRMDYDTALAHLQRGASVIYRPNEGGESRIIASLRDMPSRTEWAGDDPQERKRAFQELKNKHEEIVSELAKMEASLGADIETEAEPVPATRQLADMTLEELKELCRENELAVSGTKAEVVARLEEFRKSLLAAEEAEDETEQEGEETE